MFKALIDLHIWKQVLACTLLQGLTAFKQKFDCGQ